MKTHSPLHLLIIKVDHLTSYSTNECMQFWIIRGNGSWTMDLYKRKYDEKEAKDAW